MSISGGLDPIEADDRTGQHHEREPPPRVAVPSHLQAPPTAQPGQGPLDLPAVPLQPRRGLDPTPGDPRPDPTAPQIDTVGRAVVGLVSMDRARPSAPLPRGVSTGGTSSSTAWNIVVSATLAAVTTAVSGSPLPSQTRCSLDPALPRSTGFAPTWSPALGAHAHGIHARPRPFQPPRHTQLVPRP
jgi:hypothetical protein